MRSGSTSVRCVMASVPRNSNVRRTEIAVFRAWFSFPRAWISAIASAASTRVIVATARSPKRRISLDEAAQVEAMIREGLDLAVATVKGWRVRVLADMLAEEPFMTGAEVKDRLKRWGDDVFFAAGDEDEEEWAQAA